MDTQKTEIEFDCFVVKCVECQGTAKLFIRGDVVIAECDECGSENAQSKEKA